MCSAPDCCDRHDTDRLSELPYAYLLGLYLGDGCITANGTSWLLRITMDERYERVLEECQKALTAVAAPSSVRRWSRRGSACADVGSTRRC